MEQLCFFPEAGQSKGLPTDFLEYFPGLLSVEEGNRFLQSFIADTPWKQTTQSFGIRST
jgi:hypothetical protein